MLPKKNRADKKAIESIFKDGRFVSSPNLTLKFIHTKESGKRISFVVPKTVSKSAVVRNLLRRRGYALDQKYFDLFPTSFTGAFIFGKKSKAVFGGAQNKKNKVYQPKENLEAEIKIILNKLHFNLHEIESCYFKNSYCFFYVAAVCSKT